MNSKLMTAMHFVCAHWRWRVLSGDRLTQYQERRARQIVAFANRYSPFYRSLWAGRDWCDWRNLPTIDKQSMMEHFGRLNTVSVQLDSAMHVALKAEQNRDFRPMLNGLTVGLSSGTSDHRGIFLVSNAERCAWAGTILARTLHHLTLSRSRKRVAFFLRSHSNLYAQTNSLLIELRYFDLMLPLTNAIAALNDYQPHIIVGPPSLLRFLGAARKSDTLRSQPERLISVAEVLEPQEQERLASIFQTPVHQIYQCTEGLLAVCCVYGSLHIQEDIVALQFESLSESEDIEADGNRVTPIVTNLWRRTQPIIRYRLNDILQLSKHPCRCGSGFRVIESIEGRCDDICYFELIGGGRCPFFPDTIRRMILLSSPHIQDYQVIQERDGCLRVHLEIDSATAFVPQQDQAKLFDQVVQSVHNRVATTVAHYGCRPVAVQIERGLPPIEASLKRRRVQRVK
ncbi:hypothetical protein KFU94_14570 [Chloroflexi bacterium TSY]|nr:hypothetical protein [Chloroflexi bacterium TSY]